MNYPLQTLIRLGLVPAVNFPTDSRYYGSTTLSYIAPDGQNITYLARRIVPRPGSQNYARVARHTVKQGDLLAANYIGDPLMYWLICDANGAIRPNELVETPGNNIDITMPQGVPGVPNAT
jgi:hypothetical protein